MKDLTIRVLLKDCPYDFGIGVGVILVEDYTIHTDSISEIVAALCEVRQSIIDRLIEVEIGERQTEHPPRHPFILSKVYSVEDIPSDLWPIILDGEHMEWHVKDDEDEPLNQWLIDNGSAIDESVILWRP